MITQEEVRTCIELREKVNTRCIEIANLIGKKSTGGYLCDDTVIIYTYGGDKNPSFPLAVLWNDDIRAVEIVKWLAENNTEVKERAEYERLKAKYDNG